MLIQEMLCLLSDVTPVTDPAVAPSVNQQEHLPVAKGIHNTVRQGIVVISLLVLR
jgi:hypothetical protein